MSLNILLCLNFFKTIALIFLFKLNLVASFLTTYAEPTPIKEPSSLVLESIYFS